MLRSNVSWHKLRTDTDKLQGLSLNSWKSNAKHIPKIDNHKVIEDDQEACSPNTRLSQKYRRCLRATTHTPRNRRAGHGNETSLNPTISNSLRYNNLPDSTLQKIKADLRDGLVDVSHRLLRPSAITALSATNS